MNEKVKMIIVAGAIAIVIFILTVGPDGPINVSLTNLSGTELLQPITNSTFWSTSSWNSQSDYPTNGRFYQQTDGVTIYQRSDYLSCSASSIAHGNGPTALGWGAPIFNISLENPLVIEYTGRLENMSAQPPFGWIAQGVDCWFDVRLPNGTVSPFEMFIHFYEGGIWKLPLHTFNNFGLRQDYNYELKKFSPSWNYIYAHPFQDTIGQVVTHRFLLNQFITVVQSRVPDYAHGKFFLMRIESPIEMIFGEGAFTINELSLQVV